MKKSYSVICILASMTAAANLQAADFTWSATSESNWSTGTNWSGGSAPSSTGTDTVLTPDASSLSSGTYYTALLDVDANLASVSYSSSANWFVRDVGTHTFTVGSITKSGNGILTFQTNTNATYNLTMQVGSVTVNGGTLSFGRNNNYSTTQVNTLTISGLTTITSGALTLNSDSATLSEVQIASGAELSVFARRFGGTTSGGATVSGLSGNGTVNTIHANLAASTDVLNGTLTINPGSGQSYSFAGAIVDRSGTVTSLSGTVTLSLVKNGAGVQTLSGANTYTGTTTVNAGTLLVNGTHTGAGAYSIGGTGTLGGTGSITTNNQDVVLASGGKFSPGDGGVGTLTFSLGTGTLDLSGGLASAGALTYTIGTTGTADQIAVTSGSVNIGTGLLDLNSFNFDFLGTAQTGQYTLLSSSTSIIGTLGSQLSGTIGGYNVELALANSNRDLILTVTGTAIPEPSASALLFGVGAVMVGVASRRIDRR